MLANGDYSALNGNSSSGGMYSMSDVNAASYLGASSLDPYVFQANTILYPSSSFENHRHTAEGKYEQKNNQEHGCPILMRIHCFGVDVMIDITVPKNEECTILWGYVAYKALRKWRSLLPATLTLEHQLHLQKFIPAEGPYEVILYEPGNRRIYRADQVISAACQNWSLADPPLSFRLVIEGSILHHFSCQQLQMIFSDYLVTRPTDLLPLLLTCRKFKRAFAQYSVWEKLVWSEVFPLFRWQGLGGRMYSAKETIYLGYQSVQVHCSTLISEAVVWKAFATEHNLTASETFRLRHASYRASRLKFYYGTLSSTALSNSPVIGSLAYHKASQRNKWPYLHPYIDQKGAYSVAGPEKHEQTSRAVLLWEDAIVRDQVLQWTLQQLASPFTLFSRILHLPSYPSFVAPFRKHVYPQYILPIWTLSSSNLRSMSAEICFNIEQKMKRFIDQLHFIVPTSATSYHLQLQSQSSFTSSQTLFPHATLLHTEPSPVTSRSRTLPIDPGTRVEKTEGGDQYRRIGDTRLTFMQCSIYDLLFPYDHDDDNDGNGDSSKWGRALSELREKNMANAWMGSQIRDLLLDKTNGTVIWLSLPAFVYETSNDIATENEDTYTSNIISTRKSERRWILSNSTMFAQLMIDLQRTICQLQQTMLTSHWLPVLIFVGTSFQKDKFHTINHSNAKNSNSIDNKYQSYKEEGDMIHEMVAEIAENVQHAFSNHSKSSSTNSSNANNRFCTCYGDMKDQGFANSTVDKGAKNTHCHWYIQPYNQEAEEEDLQQGLLPGWNWLWRTLEKQRDAIVKS